MQGLGGEVGRRRAVLHIAYELANQGGCELGGYLAPRVVLQKIAHRRHLFFFELAPLASLLQRESSLRVTTTGIRVVLVVLLLVVLLVRQMMLMNQIIKMSFVLLRHHSRTRVLEEMQPHRSL